MKTLMAGGAIASRDIVRLVADDPLGLRPEMTASIARAACTRLATRPRPMRLWASGTVFRSRAADEGGQCIEENLQERSGAIWSRRHRGGDGIAQPVDGIYRRFEAGPIDATSTSVGTVPNSWN